MSKRVVSIALLFFAFMPLMAKSVSLEDIFSYTSKNALSLKMKQLDVSIEKSNISDAKSGYYPTFNLLYNTEYTESLDGVPLGTESIGGITISNGTRYQNSAALQMNYNLYSFGATDKAVLAAKLSADSKDKDWCLQEKKLYEQILQTYADALKISKDKEYKARMLQIRKKLYSAKERLYKAGQYSKVDLGDEAIYLITLERDIEDASMQYQEDVIKISQLSYMPINKKDELLPLSTKNDINQSTQPFEESVDALVLERKMEAKKVEISMYKRQQFPTLAMYGNYYAYASNPTEYDYPITHLRQKSWNVGFSIRFNIFNGFKDSTKLKRLSLELQRAQTEFSDAKHNYLYENKNKLSKLKELSILQNKDEKLLEQNREKIVMIKRLRQHQKVDLLTQLNAEYELLERTLNLEKREIDKASTALSLQIANRGLNQCTQH
jgi:outer membrane protein TolC